MEQEFNAKHTFFSGKSKFWKKVQLNFLGPLLHTFGVPLKYFLMHQINQVIANLFLFNLISTVRYINGGRVNHSG